MPLTADDAAARLLGAAGIDASEVPPRRFGADWFREQPAWLAAATAAHRLVADTGFDPAPALHEAAAVLDDPEADPEAVQLVEVGFIEAMVCAASNGPGDAGARIVAASPLRVWGVWHRRRERLEALSDERFADDEQPVGLESDDPAVAMLAACTTYRAESGRYVVLADLISADRPSPWPLRHPVMVGLIFGAFLFLMLVLSLALGG